MVEKREYRTAVEDAAATKRIRKELGFPEELAVENRRTVFVREDIHVVLDKKT